MVLTAMRGAFGFLSRLPVGHSADGWNAFRTTPATFPLVGYALGAVAAIPLAVPWAAPTAALAFVVWIYVVTGITHVDGVADLGDAAVAHGDAVDRREIMTDTAVGTGGVLAVALVALGLATAGLGLAGLPSRALLLVVTAEVGAKTAMALQICLGEASHEGLGSALTDPASPRTFVPVAVLAVPAAALLWPRVVAPTAALAAAVVTAALVLRWARRELGGVSGDVLGATNELARVAALHAGVIAWTLS